MMPKGYGGYERDNTLAYSEFEETPEEYKARKEAEFGKKLGAERDAGEVRRGKLTKLVVSLESKVHHEAEKVTEDDLEFIHGEEEFEGMLRQRCFGGNYVDKKLQDGKARAMFIMRALLPVMCTYAVATVYALCFTVNYTLRNYFYSTSLSYFLISAGCWIGLNILGRVVQNRKYTIPIFVMRSLAFCNFLASSQLYAEFYKWEVAFTHSIDDEVVKRMETELKQHSHFQESWLNLPKDPHVNDLHQRKDYSHAFFGALLAFSFFFSTLWLLIGLFISSKRENVTADEVLDHWIQRTAGFAGLIPPSILYFINYTIYSFLNPPRSWIWSQSYGVGIIAIEFGMLVSTMWGKLLAGEMCFIVLEEDALYFGFMFSL